MNRLRNRLILLFFAVTLPPLALTLLLAQSLVDPIRRYAPTGDLDQISRSLEETARVLYQQARQSLREEAARGHLQPTRFRPAGRPRWPREVVEFHVSGDPRRFLLAGRSGERLRLLERRGDEVWAYTKELGIGLQRIRDQYTRARESLENNRARDLRRGFLYTLLLLAAVPWLAGFGALLYSAHRISRPIQQLTAALAEVAEGNLEARVSSTRNDEVGRAITAFNRMADQLRLSRERLLYLTRLEIWQALARKMAHELKNSLTPIRLTTEEMMARQNPADEAFNGQAAEIIVEEVNRLERRVRAFSEFAAEPPVRLTLVDINALVTERIAFLKPAHPATHYDVRLAPRLGRARADEDLARIVLTNLLENAAEAAGDGGRVLAVTKAEQHKVWVEVHDSGPGLSEQARAALFEPTISLKKGGMGLGLSIARKSAVLCGGDIERIAGELGGAGFRIVLGAP